jgi:hypothetical protein
MPEVRLGGKFQIEYIGPSFDILEAPADGILIPVTVNPDLPESRTLLEKRIGAMYPSFEAKCVDYFVRRRCRDAMLFVPESGSLDGVNLMATPVRQGLWDVKLREVMEALESAMRGLTMLTTDIVAVPRFLDDFTWGMQEDLIHGVFGKPGVSVRILLYVSDTEDPPDAIDRGLDAIEQECMVSMGKTSNKLVMV